MVPIFVGPCESAITTPKRHSWRSPTAGRSTNTAIGAKRRIAGLKLNANDVKWVHGDGPEVIGPMIALVLAMSGRSDAHRDLSGEGLIALASRN